MNRIGVPALALALLASGCAALPAETHAPQPLAQQPTTLPAGDRATPAGPSVRCKLGDASGQPLPDPVCTPGAVNPVVTQDNIATTICKTGWTKTVRPSTSVTGRIKKATIQAYGLPADTAGELDHLVSLQLGGAPEDTRNLWVEPGNIPNPKDTVESKLNAAICSGLIPLVVGQKTIASNWTTALDASGLTATGKVCLRSVPAQCVRGRHGDGD